MDSQLLDYMMSAYLLIMPILAVVLLVVWQWDERARRAELDRRRQLWRTQMTMSQDNAATTPSPMPPSSVPTIASQLSA